jgi:ubiquinone/menaquinone biosynthesis C-methylase UbiE
MTLLRQLVKRLLRYDDQSLMRFDQVWQDWYRQTMGDASVLDVGCGTGSHSEEVLKFGRARRYIGIDISTGLVTSATHSFPQHVFCVGDSCHLPLQDQSVDVAITSFTFHHIQPDQRIAALKDLMRVARTKVILRDVFGVDRGFRGWLYQTYYSVVDGSFHRCTLNEWHDLIWACGGQVTQVFHTGESMLVSRHLLFVITTDLSQ